MLETCKPGAIADAIVRMRGWDPEAFTLSGTTRQILTDSVNEAIRTAWGYQMWPALLRVERRQFRPNWRADVYLDGCEVFHGGKYWRVREGGLALATHEPGVSEEWQMVERPDFIPFVMFEQPWENNAISEEGYDLNAFAWEEDPRQRPDLPAVKGCRLWMDSIIVPTDAKFVWVRFKPQEPRISFVEWDSDIEYEYGEIVYRTADGRCFRAKNLVEAGTPLSNADYWQEVRIPRMFAPYIQSFACSQWLTRDEGRYEEEARAERILEELARRQFERRGGTNERPRLRVR